MNRHHKDSIKDGALRVWLVLGQDRELLIHGGTGSMTFAARVLGYTQMAPDEEYALHVTCTNQINLHLSKSAAAKFMRVSNEIPHESIPYDQYNPEDE